MDIKSVIRDFANVKLGGRIVYLKFRNFFNYADEIGINKYIVIKSWKLFTHSTYVY